VDCRAVVKMFSERGVTAIVNDEIVDVVLSMGHLVIALFCCGVAYIYGYSVHLIKVDRVILANTGFLAGYLVCTVTLKVIASAVATVYVLYAEEPQEFEVRLLGRAFAVLVAQGYVVVLQTSNPELFEELAFSWKAMYPANRKSSHADVIHRDAYGGIIEPEVAAVEGKSVKIAGRYERVSTDEYDEEDATESVILGSPPNPSKGRSSTSPNPYGSSGSGLRSPSNSNKTSWATTFQNWYGQSVLLYKAAIGEDIRNPGDGNGSGYVGGDSNSSGNSAGSRTSSGSGGGRTVISGSWGNSDSGGDDARRNTNSPSVTSV
jgi:uncharacterized membrane protein YgcG